MPNIDYDNRKPKAIHYGENLNIRIGKDLKERLYKAKDELNRDVASLTREAIEMYLNALNQ